jgi:hypothetical protein
MSLEERPTTQLEGCPRNSSYDCPVERYLSDCSGYVGMAWRTLDPFPTPNHFLQPTVAAIIACRDLQPGDAIVSSNHVQVCHVLVNSHASRVFSVCAPAIHARLTRYRPAAALPQLEQPDGLGIPRLADGWELGQSKPGGGRD